MCYIRGSALDYDHWAQAPGLEDWTYADCLPYFRKSETRDIGPDDYHGGDGPVSVTTPKAGNNPLYRTFIERSEERRVGKECRSRRSPAHEKNKKNKEI